MDGNSLILAGGLVSLAIRGGVGCFNKKQKIKALSKVKLSSLILSKGTGKTNLKEKLQSLTSDLIIVDMNEAIKDFNDELDFLQKGKEYVDNLLKKFVKKRFLLLVNSKNESEYFGVSKSNSFVVCPSIKLFNKILGDCDEGKEKRLEIEKQRLHLIKDTDTDQLNIFESFDNLYETLKRIYKLQSTF